MRMPAPVEQGGLLDPPGAGKALFAIEGEATLIRLVDTQLEPPGAAAAPPILDGDEQARADAAAAPVAADADMADEGQAAGPLVFAGERAAEAHDLVGGQCPASDPRA